MRLLTRVAIVGLIATAAQIAAQTSAAASRPLPGAFVGMIRSTVDSSAVQGADIRLYRIDTVRYVRVASGDSVLEMSIDTVRSRLGVTNESGYFAIWRIEPGRYLMQTRRIGYSPAEAVVRVDTETVLYDFSLAPVTPMLARVEIKETATSPETRRLERSGFATRSHSGMGQFHKGVDLMKRKPLALRDILNTYGIGSNSTFVFDKMALSYDDIIDYPAELVAGIEIYRHNWPVEFSGPRASSGMSRAQTGYALPGVLVVIWTFIP